MTKEMIHAPDAIPDWFTRVPQHTLDLIAQCAWDHLIGIQLEDPLPTGGVNARVSLLVEIPIRPPHHDRRTEFLAELRRAVSALIVHHHHLVNPPETLEAPADSGLLVLCQNHCAQRDR
jgi:hypothetical protein